MKTRPSVTPTAFAGLVIAGLSGCSPMTEREIAEREYRRGEVRAEFLEYRRACRARGGTVIIRSRGRLSPDGMPKPGDTWYCRMP